MASTNFVKFDTSCHETGKPWTVSRGFKKQFFQIGTWPSHCYPLKASQCQDLPKRTKMSRETALTILIPLFILSLSFFAMSVVTKFKRWRKRRTMERGVTDFMHQVHSRKSTEEQSRSVPTPLRAGGDNRRKIIRLEKR